MKKLVRAGILLILTLSLTTNCSNDESSFNQEESSSNLKSLITKDPINCQDITIGISWPITIQTTVSYCCVGDWCIPTIALPCYNCGILSNSNQNVNLGPSSIQSLISTKKDPMTVHVRDLFGDQKLNVEYIVVSSSGSIIIDNNSYSFAVGEYEIDPNGFVSLELVLD